DAVLILGRADLETLLTPRDVIDALAQAFGRHAGGRTSVPPRGVTSVGAAGMLLVMPAASLTVAGEYQGGGLGVKLVTYYPRNRERGHATHLASYILMDHATGEPQALLEASFLTALRTGTHVDAVGSFRPETREVDTETVRRARVVVDAYPAALAEAGDLLIPLGEGAITLQHVVAELAELVAGSRQGRERPDQVTLFKSVGFALEDLAAATLAYDRARARSIGLEVT